MGIDLLLQIIMGAGAAVAGAIILMKGYYKGLSSNGSEARIRGAAIVDSAVVSDIAVHIEEMKKEVKRLATAHTEICELLKRREVEDSRRARSQEMAELRETIRRLEEKLSSGGQS